MPKVPDRPLSKGEKLNQQRRRPFVFRKLKVKNKLKADPQWSKPEEVIANDLKRMFRE